MMFHRIEITIAQDSGRAEAEVTMKAISFRKEYVSHHLLHPDYLRSTLDRLVDSMKEELRKLMAEDEEEF